MSPIPADTLLDPKEEARYWAEAREPDTLSDPNPVAGAEYAIASDQC